MTKFSVTGMTCAACSARVEKAVLKVDGVESCAVSLLTNSMGVEGRAKDADIIAAVEKAGYNASLKTDNENANTDTNISQAPERDALADKETPKLKKRLFTSLGFLIVLMYISMGHVMHGFPLPSFLESNHLAIGLLQMLLTIIIMIINQKFFISGFKSLIHRAPNMDTLVALGASAAFGYSTYALFAMTDALTKGSHDAVMSYMHELYFESAAMILTLITLGKMLEAYSKGKTTSALKSLMELAPKTATVIRDNIEVTVNIAEVRADDIFIVRPGENIPVDGIVTEGSSTADESSLTGESIPVDKTEGSTVSAGTLNQSGFIKCKATRVGRDTTLSQIIQMVSDASATKAPIAKAADKVSGIFVPAVIIIAVITIIVWLLVGQTVGFALARGISVLVISCPCALGLATPVAIMVGSGKGAKNGILFKTAVSLEKTGKAKIVALDKTGTVTEGKPKVTDIITFNGADEESLMTMAYSLEKKSEHPLARAICEKSEEMGLNAQDTDDFQAVTGNGLTAKIGENEISGGSFKFISSKINMPKGAKTKAESLSEEGKTPLFFAKGNILWGMIAVADTIKEDSPKAIKQMEDMGIHVVMLTGDNERTAKAIGAKSGIQEVIAGVLPGEKEKAVRELQKKGEVIMVGDGINDAPALTTADVGIAIGAGADIAIDAADAVLIKSSLSDVPAAIRLSRAVLRNIHENLFWAFIYNIVGIPLAAGVFISTLGWQLNPMFGAAAMSLSSFSVVTNALRLNFFKMKDTGTESKPKEKPNITTEKEKEKMTKTMTIKGMMCGHCEMHVKKALEALDGVVSAEPSHQTGTAVVTLEKDVPNELLKKAVEEQDYEVTEIK